MGLEIGSYLALLLLGGIVTVDGTSYGQFMISRPFAAATLAGLIVGSPAQGAMIGLVLEALHLPVLPVGAAKYPEGGPAAVAAGAVYALSQPSSVLLLTLTVGVVGLEWLGGESVRLIRIANVRIVKADGGSLPSRQLELRHLAAIGLDFVRGVLLCGGGLLLLFVLARYVAPTMLLSERIANLAILAVVVAMLGSAFRMFGYRIWFAAVGAAVGVVILTLNP